MVKKRQNYFRENINDNQKMITCTGLDEIVKNRFSLHRVFEVIDGKVFEKANLEQV